MVCRIEKLNLNQTAPLGTGAIDMAEPINFLKLYKEERRRSRNESKATNGDQPKELSTLDPSEIDLEVDPDAIEPIDFKSLVAQEVFARKLPEWNYPSMKLSRFQGVPDQIDGSGVFYTSQFLPEPEFQGALIAWLQKLSINHRVQCERASFGKWTNLPHAKRRVAVFQSHPAFPPPIQYVVDAVTHIFPQDRPPNHVLVNEYQSHQGILPHTDGPAYDDCTATISLGDGSVLLQFVHDKGTSSSFQVLLEGHGSLVVFKGSAYSDYRHGIEEGCSIEHANETCRNAAIGTVAERDYRISITIRHKRELLLNK